MIYFFLLGLVTGLGQESRLTAQFCSTSSPPEFFQTSITTLTSLYDYVVPKDSDSQDGDVEQHKVNSTYINRFI